MAKHIDLARLGERLAERRLKLLGYRTLDRNWRCAQGELDLVMRNGADIVIIEVKTRSGTGYGHPFSAITEQKIAQIRKLSWLWRAAHPSEKGNIRLDAVSVLIQPGSKAMLEHLRGVF